MLYLHRFRNVVVIHAVMFVLFLASVEQPCTGNSSDSENVTAPKVESVFPQPSGAELAEITQPKLREELLKMVSEDQVARKTGT